MKTFETLTIQKQIQRQLDQIRDKYSNDLIERITSGRYGT